MDKRNFRTWETPRPTWDAVKDRVLENRHNPTAAEEQLWKGLRKLKSKGLHFRRQHSVGRFIVDFYCWKLNLAIEVDGPIHEYQRSADEAREQWLRQRGVRVLRFSNDQVLNKIGSVMASISREASQLRED